jgi:hypothetical protein
MMRARVSVVACSPVVTGTRKFEGHCLERDDTVGRTPV